MCAFLCSVGMFAAPGDEIKSPENVVSGKSYYIKGVTTISKVETTVYFGPTEDDAKNTKISSSAVTDIKNAMPITFTKVATGWVLTTPNGNYWRPHTSNGQSYFVENEVIMQLASGDTKEGRGKGIKIGPWSAEGSSDKWYIQSNTSSAKIGAYKNTQYDVTLIEADTKTSTKLSFSTKTFNVDLGDPFVEPTLTCTPSAISSSVTFSSSNTEVATVNASTGKVTIKKAGSVDITASFAGDATYRPSSDKYTINVKVPANWYAPFTIYPKESGTNSDGSGLSGTNVTNFFTTSTVDYISSVSVTGKVYPAKTGCGWKFGDSSTAGTLTFAFNKAMTYSKIVFNATLFSGSDNTDGFKITINDDNTTSQTFTFVGKTAGTFDGFEYIPTQAVQKIKIEQVNATKARFYMKDIVFYPCSNVTVSAAGYATFYSQKAKVKLPTGVSAYVGYMDNGTFTFGEAYESGKVVPAGEPIILKAAADTYILNYSGEEADESWKEAGMNNLRGTATAITAAQMAEENPGDNYFYALSLNSAHETSSVGFYWDNATGASFDLEAGKAYLVLPQSSTMGAKAFVFNEDVTTGIHNIQNKVNNSVAYNLAGQRVAKNTKGLVILNGKKMFNK